MDIKKPAYPLGKEKTILQKENLSFEERGTSVSKITVNLLPPEVIIQRKHNSKLALVNRVSMVALVVLVFFSSTTLALRISQSFELQKAQKGLALAEGRVSSLKSREEQAAILKQRLDAIQNLMGTDAKRKAIFNLIIFLLPPEIQVSDIIVDENGNMALSLSSPSLRAIEVLTESLSNKEKSSDMVAKVDLDGLSVGKDSAYRFSLKITPKN